MRLRFAPSPTGFLHVGNVRIALFNYLAALKHGGEFILRIDDTGKDAKREFERAIEEDLSWLGISWDRKFRQSERFQLYERYFNLLVEKDLLYPCFCTPEELERERRLALASGRPPRYSGKCRRLSHEERKKKLEAGVPHCWRFKVPKDGAVVVDDLVKGKVVFRTGDLYDFVVRRSDGSFLYIFTSSVDDGEMGITHVFRGEDHLPNAPFQILLMEAMGFSPPVFVHFPLIVDRSGRPLSKREKPISIRDLRDAGYLSRSIALFLFLLGRSSHINKCISLEEMAQEFDPSHYGASRCVFSEDFLKHCNRLCLTTASLSELEREFVEFCGKQTSREFLSLFRENAHTLLDLKEFHEKVVEGNFQVSLSDEEEKIIKALLEADLDPDAVSERLSVSRGKVLRTLRKAITGVKHGPPIFEIVKLLGGSEVKSRLKRLL